MCAVKTLQVTPALLRGPGESTSLLKWLHTERHCLLGLPEHDQLGQQEYQTNPSLEDGLQLPSKVFRKAGQDLELPWPLGFWDSSKKAGRMWINSVISSSKNCPAKENQRHATISFKCTHKYTQACTCTKNNMRNWKAETSPEPKRSPQGSNCSLTEWGEVFAHLKVCLQDT